MTTTATRSRRTEEASTEWPDFAPQTGLADGPLRAAQAADRELARQYALRARALAGFAAARPASVDRAQGEPGAMSAERWAARPQVLRPVSEWAAQEVSIGLTCSQGKAETILAESLTLVSRLPGTLAALEGGQLTVDHRFCLLDMVGPIADDRLRAEIEAEVLRWVAARAARKTITTPGQLRAKTRNVVARRDARNAAQRALRALRERGVFRQSALGEGLAGLGVVGTEPEIAALHAALGAYADVLDDPEDRRTRGEKMLAVLLDLVLRPGEGSHAPVQVALTLVAGVATTLGGDAPAELGGQVVSAETARQLLNALAGTGLGNGALAELRRLADTEPPDAEDDGSAAVAVLDPFTPAEQALIELSAWFDERPWRIAAGELDPADGEPPEELLAAWPGDLDELFEDGSPDDDVENDEPDEDAQIHDLTTPPPAVSGWWAAADRAVTDAGRAMFDAQQALGNAQRMVRTAEAADAAEEAARENSASARVDAATDAIAALDAATDADRAELAALLARTAGSGLADRPRLALVDVLSGALVCLTDLPGLRRIAHCGRPACRRDPERCEHDLTGCPGVGAPGPTDGYRPGAALDRHVRARDRRCRFPGCRRTVSKGELDHRVAWPHGATDVTNLAGFCTGDHRGKHQAPGFGYDLEPDGTLVVSIPSGLVATTEAPPF